MRLFFLTLVGLMGAVAIWFGTHHSIAALVKRVGDDGIQLALAGEPLTREGAERVKQSRTRALDWVDDRRSHVEIGIANLDQAIKLPVRSPERAARLSAAQQAIEASLSLSPVQPIAWLLLSQTHADGGDWPAAANTLAMSLRTGHFIAKDARLRSALGILTWEVLDEATIERLLTSVAFMVERDPALVARLAADGMLEEEIALRLVSRPEKGADLWRRFANALQQEVGVVLRPTLAQP